MKNILTDRTLWLSIIITFIFLGTGILFILLGWTDYSWVLFLLLPFILGFTLRSLPKKKMALFGAILTTIILMAGLYIPGLSGLLCIVMALPFMIAILFIGYVIAELIASYRNTKKNDKLPVLILPLLIFVVAAPTEHYLKTEKETVMEVKTEQVFNYTCEQVYDAIKSVDTLVADKPFLMQFDLPVPVKCVLEKEEVGGLRTCYFDGGNLSNRDFGGGTITEKITALERGKLLKMDVIDYNLIGRKWLGFKEAIYYFEPVEGGKCKMTRITTYTSVLSPRFYWEPLERLGVNQEHDYVFSNLQNDLERVHGKK